jgi:DNA replication ATP-dependent helicase Dna2
MPSFGKKSLSLLLRTRCELQFLLSLYTDKERRTHGMPPLQDVRAALGIVRKAGYDWQERKLGEMQEVFGHTNVTVGKQQKGNRREPTEITAELLRALKPNQFIVEGKYRTDTRAFRSAVSLVSLKDIHGADVKIENSQPDIIQLLPPLAAGLGPDSEEIPSPYELGVRPNGDVFPLDVSDSRLRLRIIDIKLTSEPGAHYFAEVVYYSMSLAAWLREYELEQEFVVVAAPAVWPGSHEASNLAKQAAEWKQKAYAPTAADMAKALESDLELAPVDVFAPRLRRLIAEQLPDILATPWQRINAHVDYRCKGCEFLGYPWIDKSGKVHNDPKHCWPRAEDRRGLSRVPGLSEGASEHLRHGNIPDLDTLEATNPAAPVFDEHQGLRAKRTAFPHRAKALRTRTSSVIPNSGGDALMPVYPALRIYPFLDYDLSSAITVSIALRASWDEPLPVGSSLQRNSHAWTQRQGEDEIFLIDTRSLNRERDEFLKFLRQLREIFNWVTKQDSVDTEARRRDSKTQVSTYQIYLWDESQQKHLARLVGRHLLHILADPKLRDLAWLFPPPELLQNAEEATRQSPITLVSTVVDNTVATPVPHYHQLLEVARHYKPDGAPAPSVHPLYQEPMSDLIPAERIHEYWEREGRWTESEGYILRATRNKAYALNLVVQRLERDLKDFLSRQAAPPIVRPRRVMAGEAPQGRLWLEFTRLNAALEGLEAHTVRSMPPHEREARLKSARLTKRLSGAERQQALDDLSKSLGRPLSSPQDLLVYKMRDASREINARPGDFTYAISPEKQHGFLDQHPNKLIRAVVPRNDFFRRYKTGTTIASEKMTGVTIVAIDRINGYIALRPGERCRVMQFEQDLGVDFSRNVILDPIFEDFLTKKIELTVKGIGFPSSAGSDARVLETLGLPPSATQGSSPVSPAAEVLWEAPSLAIQPTGRNLQNVKSRLLSYFQTSVANLDQSQWRAWEMALSYRLSMMWGPPGTGKSSTLRAVVLGVVLEALEHQRYLRLLITANTYTAMDNVLLDAENELKELLPGKHYDVYRIQSKWHPRTVDLSEEHPDLRDLILNPAKPAQEITDLREQLENPSKVVIVGCVPQQLHNLAVAGKTNKQPAHTIRQWFDLILLDEASQMDVATSTLVFTKLVTGGSCVLAGDDLQLSPIQKAEPPKDLEHMVGSVYNYFRRHHGITPNSLDINYRSNKTLVDFTKFAGYSPNLQSNSPDLKLHLSPPVPTTKPHDWPTQLYWSADWEKFLDPNYPAICFVYDDKLSSQVNDFEADAVAALLWLLHGHLTDKLLNERKPDGTIDTTSSSSHYKDKDFWDRAVGVVTPHRAQMAKIIDRLRQVFPERPAGLIRDAVDTVERFQGQQRDVIVASFGLGDPDIIRSEDEFLYSLNRFNVLTSRARAKLIVLVTRSLLEHLSNDVDVLKESRLLKRFAESFCTQHQPIQVGFIKKSQDIPRAGVLRRR